jgi:hypothetical protein
MPASASFCCSPAASASDLMVTVTVPSGLLLTAQALLPPPPPMETALTTAIAAAAAAPAAREIRRPRPKREGRAGVPRSAGAAGELWATTWRSSRSNRCSKPPRGC